MSAFKKIVKALIVLALSLAAQEGIATANNGETKVVEEEENYPFTKASGGIAAEKVAGIRVKSGKITLLSFDSSYSTADLPKDNDFSDMDFFRKYPKLMSVELEDLTLSGDMLENLQKFFPRDLKGLIVRNCKIEEENYELLADIIRKHEKLESVGLFFPRLQGKDSENILSALEARKNVKVLDITVGELTSKGSENLASLIAESAEKLRGLSLGWNKIVGEDAAESYKKIADEVRKISELKKLEIAIMELSEDDFKHIADFIGDLAELRSLRLFFGNLKNHNHVRLFENAEILKNSLDKLVELEEFNVASTDFPKDIMQLIAQAIGSMSSLKTLNVSGNALDEKNAATLSESIKANDSIVTLMANNCGMDAKAFNALCRSLAGVSIQHMYFRENKIKDGAKSLPIINMPEALIIDFSENEMTYEDAMAFIQATKGHEKLHIVNFKGNSGIESLNNQERTMKNDQLVEWKIKNQTDRQMAFFGL
ncbi:MAG: hypothetical protein LBL99_01390 [Holosporaceae bacterium]|jgi:Ran GTPase-activating protein (RanGAP) involved in mRNA processing and transport|nr:hypothetical protein [Holosporaceae bacterium]